MKKGYVPDKLTWINKQKLVQAQVAPTKQKQQK